MGRLTLLYISLNKMFILILDYNTVKKPYTVKIKALQSHINSYESRIVKMKSLQVYNLLNIYKF